MDIHDDYLFVYIYIGLYIIYTYICTYMYIYVCTGLCIYVYKYAYMHKAQIDTYKGIHDNQVEKDVSINDMSTTCRQWSDCFSKRGDWVNNTART